MNNNLNDWDSQDDFEIEGNLPSSNVKEDETFEGLEESSLYEIELYDQEISFLENFQQSDNPKYILIKVIPNGDMVIMDGNIYNLPLTPFDKIVVRRDQFEDYQFDSYMVDSDTIFGTRFLNFMQYDSNFFLCDERVLFEALIIKYRKSGFKTFYWSKAKIYDEIGVKKDRAEKIIKRFIELQILTVEKRTRQYEGKPQQVNYFFLNPSKIIELLPKIYLETAETICGNHREIVKYLKQGLKKSSKK